MTKPFEGPEMSQSPEALRDERKKQICDELIAAWEAKNGPMERDLTEKEIKDRKMSAEMWKKPWDGQTKVFTEAGSEFYFDHRGHGKYSVPTQAEKILLERFPEYAGQPVSSAAKEPEAVKTPEAPQAQAAAENLELKKAIADAPDFNSLYEIVKKSGGIEGSQKTYSPKELSDWIDGVRKGLKPEILTNSLGLRDKVVSLMEKGDNPLIQLQFIPDLHKEIYANALVSRLFDSFVHKLFPDMPRYRSLGPESEDILSQMMNKEKISYSDFKAFVDEGFQKIEEDKKELNDPATDPDRKKALVRSIANTTLSFNNGASQLSKMLFKKEMDMSEYKEKALEKPKTPEASKPAEAPKPESGAKEPPSEVLPPEKGEPVRPEVEVPPKEPKLIKMEILEEGIAHQDVVKEKLKNLGMTPEQLASIAGFEKIADSEGRVISVLEKLEQIQLTKVDEEARKNTEKHIREGKYFWDRIGRGFMRKREVAKQRGEIKNRNIDMSQYEAEIKGLIDIAAAGPEVRVLRSEDTNSYKGLVKEFLPEQEDFNRIATKYSSLPPQYKWEKYTKDQQKEFKKTADEYQKERERFLMEVNTKDRGTSEEKEIENRKKLHTLNKAEFDIRMSQTLNAYPDGAAELVRLAEKKGWAKEQAQLLKEQFVPGSAGFFIGLGTRVATKSILVASFGAIAAPATAVGLAGLFGAVRGVENAKKNIIQQDEMMRIGIEEDKASKKGIKKANFINADKLTEKLATMQKELDINYGGDYGNYLKTTKGEPMTLEAFTREKANLSERLEVRIAYTKQKMEEGRVIFGKDAESLAKQYELMQTMAQASTTVEMTSTFDGREFKGVFGNTRKGRLESLLEYKEKQLQKSRTIYKVKNAATSFAVSGFTAGVGYHVMGHIMDSYGSHGAHDVHNHAQNLKAHGEVKIGAEVDKVTEEGVKHVDRADRFAKIEADFAEKRAIMRTEALTVKAIAAQYHNINIPDNAQVTYTKVGNQVNSFKWQGKEFAITDDQYETVTGEKKANIKMGGQPEVTPTPASTPDAKVNQDILKDLEAEQAKIDKAIEMPTEDAKPSVVETTTRKVVEPIANKDDIKLNWDTKVRDIRLDNSVVDSDNFATEAPRPSVEKPYEFVLKTETQSREYALIQYLREKNPGMSKVEAGREAHKMMKDIFPPNGEKGLDYVHKGDKIVIYEKDGKPHIEVNPKTSEVVDKPRVLKPNTPAPELSEAGEAPDKPRVLKPNTPAPVLEAEATPRPSFNPRPEVTPEATPVPEATPSSTPTPSPTPESTPTPAPVGTAPEVTPEATPVPEATPAPTPEQIQEIPAPDSDVVKALSSFEVTEATNLPDVINTIVESDERLSNLTDAQKDQVVFDIIANHFVKGERAYPGFLKNMGIESEDIFNIEGGTLKLVTDGRDIIGNAMKRVVGGEVSEAAIGFRANVGKIAAALKGYLASDMNEVLILEELRKARQ